MLNYSTTYEGLRLTAGMVGSRGGALGKAYFLRVICPCSCSDRIYSLLVVVLEQQRVCSIKQTNKHRSFLMDMDILL